MEVGGNGLRPAAVDLVRDEQLVVLEAGIPLEVRLPADIPRGEDLSWMRKHSRAFIEAQQGAADAAWR